MSLFAFGPPIRGDMVNPVPSDPVTGGAIREPGASGRVQPVSSVSATVTPARAAGMALLLFLDIKLMAKELIRQIELQVR